MECSSWRIMEHLMTDFQRSVQSLYTFAAFGLLYLLIELFYIGIPMVQKDRKKKLRKKKKRKENFQNFVKKVSWSGMQS